MIERKQTDEGVSEVIGFIVVLSVILISISLVFVNAIPILEDTQEQEHISNTEKIFNTLQSNINEVVERDVPRRATELRLFNSQISIGQPFMQVNVSNESATNPDWRRTRSSSTVVYEHAGEQIIYENGAVLRTNTRETDAATGMLREPDWTVRENADGGVTVILRSVRLGGADSLSGDDAILVRTSSSSRRTLSDIGMSEVKEDGEMTLRITSENADAWRNYFERLEDKIGDDTKVKATDESSLDENEAQIEFFDDFDDDDRIMYTDNLLRASITS